jgi:hypothetical protein
MKFSVFSNKKKHKYCGIFFKNMEKKIKENLNIMLRFISIQLDILCNYKLNSRVNKITHKRISSKKEQKLLVTVRKFSLLKKKEIKC